eukprot:2637991-Prymnesium_polylepis.1
MVAAGVMNLAGLLEEAGAEKNAHFGAAQHYTQTQSEQQTLGAGIVAAMTRALMDIASGSLYGERPSQASAITNANSVVRPQVVANDSRNNNYPGLEPEQRNALALERP